MAVYCLPSCLSSPSLSPVPSDNRSPSSPEPAFQPINPLPIYPAELFPSLSSAAAEYTFTLLMGIREHFRHILPSPETWEPVDSERYGFQRPLQLSFPADLDWKVNETLVLEFNRFLLDGQVNAWLQCGLQKKFPPTHGYFPPVKTFSGKEVIDLGSKSTCHLRIEQFLYDGNHRTATLMLFEYLRYHKVQLKVHPLRVYMIISFVEQQGIEKTVEDLSKLLHRASVMGVERFRIPMSYRTAIKELPILTTQARHIVKTITNRIISLETRRTAFRWLLATYPQLAHAVVLILSEGKTCVLDRSSSPLRQQDTCAVLSRLPIAIPTVCCTNFALIYGLVFSFVRTKRA